MLPPMYKKWRKCCQLLLLLRIMLTAPLNYADDHYRNVQQMANHQKQPF
ncbi:hypothetical protein P4J24_19525 [Bacillus anthracis]|nr:hypothetical protein [Bacillus anthracis]MEB9684067.1 hypothetical protein [Bacillus anthracis]